MSDSSSMMVDLLRHGECADGQIYRGSTNSQLSDNGLEQLYSATRVTNCPWEYVVTSPLDRCRGFATSLAEQYSLPLVVDEGFREMHFGDWEGRLLEEVWKEDNQRVKQFFLDPENDAPPNGESYEGFRSRIVSSWENMLENYQGKRGLLLTHGGVIRVLLSMVLKLPSSSLSSFEVPYASLHRVRIHPHGDGRFESLVFMNGMLPEHEVLQ